MADDVPKGISSNKINGKWLKGPGFLKQPIDQWPMEQWALNKYKVDKEPRKIRITCATTDLEPVRVTAYVMSCQNIQKKRFTKVLDELLHEVFQVDVLPLRTRAKKECEHNVFFLLTFVRI